MSSFSDMKEKLLIGLAATLCTGAIAWTGWVTARIASTDPWIVDREYVIKAIGRLDATQEKISEVISNNTEAINALRVELAKTGSTTDVSR